MNDEETQKFMDDATKEGLALTRSLFTKNTGAHGAAIILGASVGSAFGAIYSAHQEKIAAKEWLTAFFITMTGGLRESMGIDLSVNWTVKDKEE